MSNKPKIRSPERMAFGRLVQLVKAKMLLNEARYLLEQQDTALLEAGAVNHEAKELENEIESAARTWLELRDAQREEKL